VCFSDLGGATGPAPASASGPAAATDGSDATVEPEQNDKQGKPEKGGKRGRGNRPGRAQKRGKPAKPEKAEKPKKPKKADGPSLPAPQSRGNGPKNKVPKAPKKAPKLPTVPKVPGLPEPDAARSTPAPAGVEDRGRGGKGPRAKASDLGLDALPSGIARTAFGLFAGFSR